MPDVPTRLDGITPAFMARVLDRAVVGIEVEQIGADAGILGALARVHLAYAGSASGPQSVIVKLPTDAPPNRAIGMAFKFYEREGRFYSDLGNEVGLPVPLCHLAHTEPEHEEFVLVLEDLRHFAQTDQATGASLEHARLAVEAVARMHGRWWDDPRQDAFEWMPRIDGPLERDQTLEVYNDGWAPFLARFGDDLSSEQIEAGSLIRLKFPGVIDRLGRQPTTIVHGDYRIDNLFFDVTSPSRPLVAIDWQIAMRSRGLVDVAYFIGGSLRVDDRRRYERMLIDEYHAVLTSCGVRDYSAEDCWTDYRWSLLYATVYPVDAGSFDLPTDHAVSMVRHWATRFFAAVTDLECVELLQS